MTTPTAQLEVFAAVLAAHPLGVTERGSITCDGCHLILGDPAQHLLSQLEASLTPPGASVADERAKVRVLDPRESSIDWSGPGGDAA